MFLLQYISDTYISIAGSTFSAELVLCLVGFSILIWSVAEGYRETIGVFRAYGRSFWIGTACVLVCTLLLGIYILPTTFWAMNNHGLELYQDAVGPVKLQPDHGMLLSLTYWLLAFGLPTLFDPWETSLFASTLAGLFYALWVRAWSGSASVSLIALCLLLLSPVHLRIAPSLSGYLLVELYLMVGFVGLEFWFLTGRKSHLRWSAAAGCLAALCRADALIFVPIFFLTVLVARGRLKWAIRKVFDIGWVGVLLALVWLARFSIALTNPDSMGGAQVRHLWGIGVFILIGLSLALLGKIWKGLAVRSWSEVVEKRLELSILSVGVIFGLWLAPWGFDGLWPSFPNGVYDVVRVIPLLHPTLVSPLLGILVGLSLIRLGSKDSLAPVILIATQAVLSFIHFVLVGEDSLSYFVRSAMLVLWGWTGLAAYVIGAYVKAERSAPGTRTLGIVFSLIVLGTAPYWRVVTYMYPSQQEGRLIFQVLPSLDLNGDTRVVSLTHMDTPWADDEGVKWHPDSWRAQFDSQRSWKGEGYYSVSELLAAPESFVGGIWFRSLSCYRTAKVSFTPAGSWAVPSGLGLVYGAGRIWAYNRESLEEGSDHGEVNLPVFGPWITLEDLPCFAYPEAGQCFNGQAEPCDVWECGDGVQLPPDASYEDHACREVAETFELEVLVEEDIAHSSLDTDLFYPLYPGVIGFYRIKGVKNNPLD